MQANRGKLKPESRCQFVFEDWLCFVGIFGFHSSITLLSDFIEPVVCSRPPSLADA